MKLIQVKNTYNVRLKGKPTTELEYLDESNEYIINPERIDNFKPKLLVKLGDTVKIGTPLYTDKKQLHLKFLSPVSGTIKAIDLGHRRVIDRIIIEKDENEEALNLFPSYSSKELNQLDTATVRSHLLSGGLWGVFNEYPFRNIPKSDTIPPAIYITMEYDEPHFPTSTVFIKKYKKEFLAGLSVIRKMSDHVFIGSSADVEIEDPDIKKEITHAIQGDYPANDPGIFLYYNKSASSENKSWGIRSLDVIRVGQLFLNGQYPTSRIVSIGGPMVEAPKHLVVREGTPLSFLNDRLINSDPYRIVCGGVLRGQKVGINDGIGFNDFSINVIREGQEQEMLSFFRPGFDKPTFSNTYLSALDFESDWALTSSINGGYRACISCGLCAKVCPVESAPQMIMKSLKENDLETAVEYGLLDIVESGLYTYVCPSKIELDRTFLNAKKELLKGLAE